jgi:hypothetical protein
MTSCVPQMIGTSVQLHARSWMPSRRMLTRRPLPILILGTLLTYGLGYAAASPSRPAWTGRPLPRISVQDQARLLLSLRTFFGNAKADTGSPKRLPGIGPSLFDQFSAVMVFPINMFQFKLPSGRLIWAYWDKNSGAYTVVVPGTLGSGTIAATALLTHLCPRNGVVENLRSTNGRAFQMHSPCEPDDSLMIFYAHGVTPDPNLNADLTRWALASIEARQRWLASDSLLPWLDRKLLLKRFVRVLDDRAIDLSVADAVFPLDVRATGGE